MLIFVALKFKYFIESSKSLVLVALRKGHLDLLVSEAIKVDECEKRAGVVNHEPKIVSQISII